MPNGGFLYQPGIGEDGYARSAAGVCSLLTSGDYESPQVIEGLREVDRRNRRAGAERAREERERESRRRLGSGSNASASDAPPPCIVRSKIEPAQKGPGRASGSVGISA